MLTIHCPECGKCSRVPEDAPDDDGLVCCPRCAADFLLDDEPPPRKRKIVRREVRRRDDDFCCPFCGSREPPVCKEVITTAGWIVFIVLFFLCFLLCFLGMLMTEKVHTCADCGIRLG